MNENARTLRRISGTGALVALLLAPVLGGAQTPQGGTLTLDEALAIAIEGNRELRRAMSDLDEAVGQVDEAWGSIYPQIDLNTTYQRNLTPAVSFLPAIFIDPDASPDELVPIQFGADNVWTANLSVEQPLFQADAFVGIGAAGSFEALQEEGVRGTLHEVVTGVRLLYYELLLAQEQARLLERSVARVAESLEETRALFRAGLVSDFEVLRLEVEVANLEPQLRRAENEARRLERELVTDLALPPGSSIAVAGTLADMNLDDVAANDAENRRLLELRGVSVPEEVSEEEIEATYRRALAANSSLQQADLSMELRSAELQAERSQYLPRVFLFGSYDIQAQQDGSPNFFGESMNRGYGRHVGIRVSFPLFTGMQRGARVDQRRAALRSAQLDRDLAELELRDRVRTLLEAGEEARLRTRSQALAVRQATRGFEIASAEYREGLTSRLELTDAEVALRESEFNYAEAVFEYLMTSAELDQAVGEVPLPGTGLELR